ncbi:MAG: hypothetical protein COA49_00445 [Bacteroidetes bacterium]|nr:MAG: hypothetical protein COA49_00445 [Bacteroidota bacterium]
MNIVKSEKTPIASISGSYGYAWQQMGKHFLYFLIVVLFLGIADSPLTGLRVEEPEFFSTNIFLIILATAYMFLVLPVLKFGGDLIFLRGIRNEKMDITELFLGFKENYVSIILASLITTTLIGIAFLFLIIPGIILAVRLCFVSFLVMDKKMEPIAAIEKSWAMTRGYGWKIFGMGILAIPVFIVGLLFCVVGVFVSFIWISAAFAAMYYAIDHKEQEELAADNQLGSAPR